MSSEQNKALIRRYFEAISGKDKSPEVVNEFVDDPALREHIATTDAAFPRFRLDMKDIVAEGDKVVVRFGLQVTHRGDFMGMPPTGRDASFDAIIIYRIANGKIAEHWLMVDVPALMQQLTSGAAAPASV